MLIPSNPTPTADQWITRSEEDKAEFKELLKEGALTPSKFKEAYLRPFTIPRSHGRVRLLVDGKEASHRGLLSPSYPCPMSVPEAISKIIEQPYRCAIDLKGAYHQVANIDEEKYLTIRINGRIYQYTTCPQGLSASPAICVEAFSRLFNSLGATAYYCDNAAYACTSVADGNEWLDNTIQYLQSLGISISAEQTIRPAKTIPFLGLIISQNRLSLPQDKIEKLQSLTSNKQLQGYMSYLSDIFGTSDRVVLERVFHPHVIHCDGAKGKYAAAVAFCGNCTLPSKVLRKRTKQGSQVSSEAEAILLAKRLLRNYPSSPIYTDAKYFTSITSKTKESLVSLAARTLCGHTLKWVPSDNNRADPYSRMETLSYLACKC